MAINRLALRKLGISVASGGFLFGGNLSAQQIPVSPEDSGTYEVTPPPVIEPLPTDAALPPPPLPTYPGEGDPYLLSFDPYPVDPYLLDPYAAHQVADFQPEVAVPVEENTLDAPLPSAPSGFATNPGSLADTAVGAILDGFHYNAYLLGRYDSNVTDGNSRHLRNSDEDEDYSLILGGSASYRTRGTRWYFGGNIGGAYTQYFNRTDLDGFDWNTGLSGGFTGEKLTVGATFSIDDQKGANRRYADYVRQTTYNYGLSASYRLSGKTSISSSSSLSFTRSDGYGDTTDFSTGLYLGWKANSRLSLSPGIRYTQQRGDIQGDRTSIGPALGASYLISNKLSVNGMYGLDFVDYEKRSGNDISHSVSLGAQYRGSDLWTSNLSLYHGLRPDPVNDGTYSQTTSLRLGYTRKIRRFTLGLGASYEITNSEDDGSSSRNAGDRDYIGLDASLSTLTFRNTTHLSIFTSYTTQMSKRSENEFDSFECGFRLSRSF